MRRHADPAAPAWACRWCTGIVSAHNGVIVVDSQPGRGSSFHIYLPCASADDSVDGTVPGVFDAAPGNGQHVLYIDDDEVMALMVERLLARAGYRVTAHHDPWVAVAAVHQRPKAFDIVVTDNMPEFSLRTGASCRRASRHRPHCAARRWLRSG